jgi:protein-disulfide isomerase-like protein with CxxC motif
MSQRQVSRYLSGTRALTIDQLDDMCIALGLDFVTVIQAADRARR